MKTLTFLIFLLCHQFATSQVYVDHSATGNNNGSSWANAYTNLQEALFFAPTSSAVYVAEGTYYPDEGLTLIDNEPQVFRIRRSLRLFGGFPSGGENVLLRDADRYRTILSGNIAQDGTVFSNIVLIEANSAQAVLDGFQLSGGISALEIREVDTTVDPSTHAIRNCFFFANSKGVELTGEAGRSEFVNCVFSANAAGMDLRANGVQTTIQSTTLQGNGTAVFYDGSPSFDETDGNRPQFARLDVTDSIIWGNDTTIDAPSFFSVTITTSTLDGLDSDPADDPLFINPFNRSAPGGIRGINLRLRVGSPAIDAGSGGTATSGIRDISGNIRSVGTAIDRGAYEHGGIIHVDPLASGNNSGTSWQNAYRNLQTALVAAQGAEAIFIAAGTYYPDVTDSKDSDDAEDSFILKEVELIGGFPNGGSSIENRTLLKKTTVLSGDITQNDNNFPNQTADNSWHVLTTAETSLVMDGIFVTAGNSQGANHPLSAGALYPVDSRLRYLEAKNCQFVQNQGTFGGALSLFDLVFRMENCNLLGNRAANDGGAIHATSSRITIDDVTFEDNRSTGDGGALRFGSEVVAALDTCEFSSNVSANDGGAVHLRQAAVTLNKIDFSSNLASRRGGALSSSASEITASEIDFILNGSQSHGGAIYTISSTVLTLNDADFFRNSTQGNGGAANFTGSTVSCQDVTFRRNTAMTGGGATYANGNTVLDFDTCGFTENESRQEGGASVISSGSGTYTNCNIAGNSADGNGGGISIESGASGTYTRCFITGNSAGGLGGGIAIQSGSPTFDHCTIHGNKAVSFGGGISNTGSGTTPPNLIHTLIWGNASLGLTKSAFSSIYQTSSNEIVYDRSMAENIDPTALDKFSENGVNPRWPVIFWDPIDPLLAPTTGGHFLLRFQGEGDFEGDTTDPIIYGAESIGAQEQWLTRVPFSNGLEEILNNAQYGTIVSTSRNFEIGVGVDALRLRVGDGVQLYGFGNVREQIRTGETENGALLFPEENDRIDNSLVVSGRAIVEGLTIQSDNPTTPPTDERLGRCILVEPGSKVIFENMRLQRAPLDLDAEPDISLLHIDGSEVEISNSQFRQGGVTTADSSLTADGLSFFRAIKAFTPVDSTLTVSNSEMVLGSIVYAEGSDVALINCTSNELGSEDSATVTGIIFSTVSVTNCLMWNNGDGPSGFFRDGSSSVTFRNSSLKGRDLTTAGTGNFDGRLPSSDPLFITAQTRTYGSDPFLQLNPLELQMDRASPYINAGLSGVNPSEFDVRGDPREENGTIDIGAYEHKRIYFDGDATGDGSGRSWSNAISTMRPLDEEITTGTTLYFAAGTYPISIANTPGVHILGGYPSGGGSDSTRDPAANPTILTRGVIPVVDVFNPSGRIPGGIYTFDDSDVISLSDDRESGLPLLFSGVTIRDCITRALVIPDNYRVDIERCNFLNNSPTGERGDSAGAIDCDADTPMRLKDSTFENNRTDGLGGAIVFRNDRRFRSIEGGGFEVPQIIENCVFIGNEALSGGAIAVDVSGAGAVFDNQTAASFHLVDLFCRNSLFQGNLAQPSGSSISTGGAIYMEQFGNGNFTNCAWQGNSAPEGDGGGISIAFPRTIPGVTRPSTRGSFTNCSFQGNSALIGSASTVLGGFYQDCIAWDNADLDISLSPGATRATPIYTLPSNPSSFSRCLIEGESPESLGDPDSLDGTNPANDPRFERPVSPFGGPATHGRLRLTTGSPAVNAGRTNFNGDPNSPDLAGNARVQGGRIDLGAYEGTVAPFQYDIPEAIWTGDADLDGTSYGAELLLGTDPNFSDPENPNAFRLTGVVDSNSGSDVVLRTTLTFGKNPSAPAGVEWRLDRSETLASGSWETVAAHDGEQLVFRQFDSNMTFDPATGLFTAGSSKTTRDRITGIVTSAPKVFYRFSAVRYPPAD